MHSAQDGGEKKPLKTALKPEKTLPKNVAWADNKKSELVERQIDTHLDFEKVALLSLQKKAIRHLLHTSTDEDEQEICALFDGLSTYDAFRRVTKSLLLGKAGATITIGGKIYTFPQKWEPTNGFLSDYKGSDLYLLLKSFVYNDNINEQMVSVFHIIDEAEKILQSKNIQTQFNGLIALLDQHQTNFTKFNEEPFLSIESWLHHQLVRIFHEIQGEDLNIHNFIIAFNEIPEEDGGIREALCNDYIYRCIVARIAKEAGKEIKDVPQEFIDKTLLLGGQSKLVQEVRDSLLAGRMPYFETRYGDAHAIAIEGRTIRETKDEYNERLTTEKIRLSEVVTSLSQNRIKEFGYLVELEDLPFDNFWKLRQRRNDVVDDKIAQSSYTNTPSTKDRDNISAESIASSVLDTASASSSVISESSLSLPEKKHSSEDAELLTASKEEHSQELLPDTRSVSTAPAVGQPCFLKVEWHKHEDSMISDLADDPFFEKDDYLQPERVTSCAASPEKEKHSLWKKIFIGAIIFGVIGAVIGAASPVLLAGAAAIAVTAAIGMAVGALFGWFAHKLGECCYRPAKESDSILLADKPEKRQALVSPRAGYNASLGPFYKSGKAPAPLDMPVRPKEAPTPPAVPPRIAHEDTLTFLSPMFPRLR